MCCWPITGPISAVRWRAPLKCRVGDTVRAGAYHSEDPYTTYGGDAVDFAWLLADDPEGPFEVVAEGETWTAGPEHEGRYFKVRATAKERHPRPLRGRDARGQGARRGGLHALFREDCQRLEGRHGHGRGAPGRGLHG